MRNEGFYDRLFGFLGDEELAPLAFQMLRRLPISKKIYRSVLGIGGDEEQELDIRSIFEFESYYNFFYRLNIIAYLSESEVPEEKQWLRRFIAA